MCEYAVTWQTAIRPETKDQHGHNKNREDTPRSKTNQGYKSTTDQHQYFCNVGSLLQEDGSITTDLAQIHNKLTDDGIEHQRFLTDRGYFKTTVAQITTKISEDALESIWYGISHVSQKLQLCTDMEAIFYREITLDEFNAVIAKASTNKSPSSTGLTFNMIKKWPDDVKKTIFTALCDLWSAKEVPHSGNGNGCA